MSHTVLFSLGTNLGDRHHNLRRAIAGLTRLTSINAVSPTYETAPWGVTDQPDFYNLCLKAETTLHPVALLDAVKRLEQEIGRENNVRWGPRLIDIDIIAVDDDVLDLPRLTIPHSELTERAFVLVPLADIAPDWQHPISNLPISTLLTAINTSSVTQVQPQHNFVWGSRTYVMGILNVTPDSFSGDGILDERGIIAQALRFVADGADILDVGGESTRPSGDVVSAEIEQSRILPIIRALRQVTDVPISIDTYRASTAKMALETGANWVNDIWGLQHDPAMAHVVAEADCPIVIMHNGRNRERQKKEDGAGGYYGYFHYDDLIGEVSAELQQSIDLALNAGVRPANIIIDPGIGFGKTGDQNLALLNQMDALKALGYPILLGTSRKGFIGHTLGGLPAQERIEGTAATTAIGIDRGADIIRVHDVRQMARVARMTDAIIRQR